MTAVRTDITDGIGRVTLDRPDALNAITVELGHELAQSVQGLGARDDVVVVVVRGAGGNFSAGGDFREVERLRRGGPEALAPLFDNFARACLAVGQIPQPVIAAVEGVAMAGGFELMQACDFAVVSSNARLCDNHVNYGQVPGGGGSQRLPRLVGRQRALAHLLTGDRLAPQDAVAWGLAYRCLEAERFDDELEELLAKIAGRRPDSLRTIKWLVRSGGPRDLDSALTLERDAVLHHIAGEAGKSGVSSFAASSGPSTTGKEPA